jgi:Calcineurin-like phosphoesterase
VAVFPDTQYYIDCRSAHFRKQVEWVMGQRATRDIRAAVTLGDLTEHNFKEEWEFYKESLKPLDPTFPFLLTLGNHDYGDAGSANSRKSFFGEFFDGKFVEQMKAKVETAEPGKLENAFYTIDMGKFSLGVLILEWSTRKKTVAWANEMLKKHSKERVMMATHAYLYSDSTRYDFKKKGTSQEWNPLAYPTSKSDASGEDNHDGEMVWQSLLKKYPNVFLTVNGHVLNNGTGLLASKGDKGNTVHQMMVNYQMLDEGGLGYLRLLEFLPDGKTLRVKTYSPSLGVYATGKDQDFKLAIDPPLWK